MKKLVLLSALGLCASGCGTLRNVSKFSAPLDQRSESPPMLVFGGTRDDLKKVGTHLEAIGKGEDRQSLPNHILMSTAHSLDVPLSLVGDAVTLPATANASMERAVNDYYLHAEDETE